jgi:hypothetical protein
LLAVKCLAAADFDVTTAVAVFRAAGPIDVLAGSLVSDPSLLIGVLTSLFIYDYVAAKQSLPKRLPIMWKGDSPKRPTGFLVGLCFIVGYALVLLPVAYFLNFLVVILLIVIFDRATHSRRRVRRRRPQRDLATRGTRPLSLWTRRIQMITVLVLIQACTLILMSAGPLWAPAESFETRDQDARIGYILDETSAWMTILLEKNRRIIQVRTEDVLARRVCATRRRIAPPWPLSLLPEQSLVALLTGLSNDSSPPPPTPCDPLG